MPDQPKTPQRAIRVPDKRWNKLGEDAEKAGSDRSKVINDLAAWYTREDGAKLPKRPDAD
jgi:hypothetical protein